MNLVQIQERLKDAPIQSVMQYANGGNPMVPPYLALAELKRRESMTQGAQAQQAMQQGQSPSVKDQVEQAAGLAALQKQMQQQGMQGLLAQARPAGIPENVPQPSRQPESEGIAGLPAGEFNFADGGIVAFEGGGPTTPAGRFVSGIAGTIGETAASVAQRQREAEAESEEKKKLRQAIDDALGMAPGITGAFVPQTSESWKRAGELSSAAARRLATAEELRGILAEAKQLRQPAQATPIRQTSAPSAPDASYAAKEAARAKAITEATPAQAVDYGREGRAMPIARGTPEQYETAEFELKGGPGAYEQAMREVAQISNPIERQAAMAALQRAKPTEPVAAPRGIAGIEGADEAGRILRQKMMAQPTIEETAAEEQKARGLYGLTQPYGEDRMQRIQAMEAARQQELGDRGMERLMRVMGGIAGRGLVGASPAYLQAMGEERAADAAFRKQMDELMGGVEERRRAEATAGMTQAQKQLQRQQELGLGVAEKIYDAEQKRKNEEARVRVEHQLRMMQPNEATIMLQGIQDIMTRTGKPFAEAFGIWRGLAQGETPAVARERIDRQREADWLKAQSDPMAKLNLEKQGIKTFQQYKASLEDQAPVAGGIPPIPAGAVRLKGAQ